MNMKLIIGLVMVVSVFCYIPQSEQQTLESEMTHEGFTRKDQIEFENWILENGKSYDNDFTLIHRMRTFMANKKEIERHNERGTKEKWGLTDFADMDQFELAQKLFMKIDLKNSDENWKAPHIFDHHDIEELRNHPVLVQARLGVKTTNGLDWKSSLTPIANQGLCGSCWAFAATDVSVSRLAIKNKAKLAHFSKTEVLDCVADDKCRGCDGGVPTRVYKYHNQEGALYENEYRPYDESVVPCASRHSDVGKGQFAAFSYKDYPQVSEVEQFLQDGPVSVLVAVHAKWPNIKSADIDCNYAVNLQELHAVVLYGYDEKNWFFKNSWGKNWGDAGFFRMSKSDCAEKLVRIAAPTVA